MCRSGKEVETHIKTETNEMIIRWELFLVRVCENSSTAASRTFIHNDLLVAIRKCHQSEVEYVL